MLLGEFLGKGTPDVDFMNEAGVQCDVPVVKVLF